MRIFLTLIIVLAAAANSARSQHDGQMDDAAIRQTMLAIWDKPEAPLYIDPVVIQGDHAVADWQQGERRGRALLRWQDNEWVIIGCAGKRFREVAGLQQAWVSSATAAVLAAAINAAETDLPVAIVQQLDQFEAVDHGSKSPGASGHHSQ